MYTVKGYSPRFRVAAHAYGRLYLYQAYRNPRAKQGSDLLDIDGKVRRVRIREMVLWRDSATTDTETIVTDVEQVERLVQLVLRSPVGWGVPEFGIDRFGYVITFELKDGTSTDLVYRTSKAELTVGGSTSRVIKPSRELVRMLREIRRAAEQP